ncbi:hypothetical protein ACFLR1_01925 [Bacteroidota bacterium]
MERLIHIYMKYALLIGTLLYSFGSIGQVNNPEFTKLAAKYAGGKYEAVLEGAESLMDNDKHRKKAEPYLWAAMSLLQLSRSEDEKIMVRHKYALKYALKHAGKAANKDKEGDLVSSHQSFFDELKAEGVALALSYRAEDDARKEGYTLKQILEFAPDDSNIRFAKAVANIKLNNYGEAEREINVSLPELTEKFKDLNHQPDPISSPLLKDAVVSYIDHLTENMYTDSARSAVFSARLFFPLDEGINERYQKLK